MYQGQMRVASKVADASNCIIPSAPQKRPNEPDYVHAMDLKWLMCNPGYY